MHPATLHGVGVITKLYFAIFVAFKESLTLNLAEKSLKVTDLGVFPLEYIRDLGSAERGKVRLISCDLKLFSKNSNLRDHDTSTLQTVS